MSTDAGRGAAGELGAEANTPTRRTAIGSSRRRRSPLLAAILSFIWPGLGELYLGSRVRAAIFAVPTVVATVWLLVQAKDGLTALAFSMLSATTAGTFLGLVVLTGVLRVVSILDAYLLTRTRAAARRSTSIAIALLVVASLAGHGLASWYGYSFVAADQQMFGVDVPAGTPGPTGMAGASATPSPSDSANPFTGELPPPDSSTSRITILLLGADSGLGYDHALTDSQIVVSIDPVKKTVVMASVPRDLAMFPMYNGGTFSGKINSLMTVAGADPRRYPDGGVGTLAREIGFLIGVKINYFAFVNLQGFEKLINAVGGVDVINPADINDPGYEFPDHKYGFSLKAGPQHLDARIGLAFVRTRKGVGDNDYTRARRQQLVLQAIRQKLLSPSMLPRIPAILDALAQTIRTDFPASRINEMVQLSQDIPDSAITKIVLGPPFATNPPMSETGGVWLLRPVMAKIKAWSIKTFGSDSAYYVAKTPSPSPSQ